MTTHPPITPNLSSPCDIEALHAQLSEARHAQQMAEVALAHEREANIAEAVRSMIAEAVQSQLEACCRLERIQNDCERAQIQLQEAQHTIHLLESRLAKLQLENRVLKNGYDQLELLCDSPSVGDSSRLRHPRPGSTHVGPLPSTASSPDDAASIPSSTPAPSSAAPGYPDPIAATERRSAYQPSWSYEQPTRSSAPHNLAQTSLRGRTSRFA